MKKPILALVPSAYNTSKLYTPIPINGDGDFTFSRSTTATRMNKAGLLEEVAVNVPRLDYREVTKTIYKNLVPFSSLSDNWGIGANVDFEQIEGIDPFGNKTDELYDVTLISTTSHQIEIPFIELTVGETYTLSIYIKSNSSESFQIAYYNGGSLVVGNNIMTIGDNQWHRYSVVIVVPAGSVATPRLRLNGFSNGTAGASYQLWGTQAELGSEYTNYEPTKTLQGYETSFSIANCPSLLIEPDSTNQVDYSQPTVGGQGWATNGTPVVTYLSDIAPDGTKTAQRYETNANSEGKYLQTEQPFTIGEFVTASFFVKHISGNPLLKINISGTSVGVVKNFYYNVEKGFVKEIQDSATQASVEDYGNGWFRIIATAEAAATGVARSTIYVSGDDPSTWLWWGAQLEASDVVTSYIETTGASATRTAEGCSNGNLSNLVEDYNGSMFAEMKSTEEVGVFQHLRLSVGTNTDNSIRFLYSSTSNIRIIYRVGGISVLDTSVSYDITSFAKFGITWDSSVIKFYANGVKVSELLNPTLIEGLDTVTINTKIVTKSLRIYNEVLTEAEAIELTK